MNTMTIITNSHGGHPVSAYEDIEAHTREPEPGSVVLTMGPWGTAWQRHFKDGLWHSTRGGGAKTWEWLLNKRNLVLVYDAEVRVDRNPEAWSDDEDPYEGDSTMCLRCGASGFRRKDGYRHCCGGFTGTAGGA